MSDEVFSMICFKILEDIGFLNVDGIPEEASGEACVFLTHEALNTKSEKGVWSSSSLTV